jgi:hypothetical protein
MLTTAIATAVTLTITPIMVNNSALENIHENKANWAKNNIALSSNIQITNVISLTSQRPGYFLSRSEQGALKRALLRSVKIIEARLA